MPEEYRPSGHVWIDEDLIDPDPDQLKVAADVLETHGFGDLARILREANVEQRVHVIEGWLFSGKSYHYVLEGHTRTLCGRGVADRTHPALFAQRDFVFEQSKCASCKRKIPRLKGKSLLETVGKGGSHG